jgi:hypothetical protein
MLIDALNKLMIHADTDEMRDSVVEIENAFAFGEAPHVTTGSDLPNRVSRQAIMRKVRVGTISFDAAFASFCEAGRPQDCIWALAERLELPEQVIDASFRLAASDRIAVLCRAACISDATYTEFSQQRLFVLRQPAELIASLMREYAVVSAAEARRAVRIVRLRFGKTGPEASEALALSA